MKASSLRVSEIFRSIQGESSRAGLPCVFVRLAGCSLGCRWCDTKYAWRGGREMSLPQILRKVRSFRVPLVEVTGGEPMEQNATRPLLRALLKAGYDVMLETNGVEDISRVPKMVMKVMDVKCPSSGREKTNLWSNLGHLGERDEIKFVIADRRDYQFAKGVIRKFQLMGKRLLFSPLFGRLPAGKLVEWVLKDRLNARVQVQMHKLIWGPLVRKR